MKSLSEQSHDVYWCIKTSRKFTTEVVGKASDVEMMEYGH